jgi:hypothetical protein
LLFEDLKGRMRISAAVLCLLYNTPSVDAFVPASRRVAPRQITLFDTNDTSESSDTKGTEKMLREEIAERNSKVENEEKYAVLDGESMTAVIEIEEEKPVYTSTGERKTLEAKLERLVKTRAYPLFLAEKAAEIVEGVIDDFRKGAGPSYPRSGTKEKVIVLGTGWGAAAFLKGIDTDLYDVTVISPRNYFLFTPMLAGASVGTVEYRSITEPIREVRTDGRRFDSHLYPLTSAVTFVLRASDKPQGCLFRGNRHGGRSSSKDCDV